jgi:electron transfer flavoprotein alpha subunit
MSVLIFLDQADGHIKKNSFEAAAYGAKLAENLNTSAEGIVLGNVNDDLTALGKYGLKKIHTVKNETLNNFERQKIQVQKSSSSPTILMASLSRQDYPCD